MGDECSIGGCIGDLLPSRATQDGSNPKEKSPHASGLQAAHPRAPGTESGVHAYGAAVALPSDTLRRAVVDPSGTSWLLELRDTGFAALHRHFFLASYLRLIGKMPPWRATLLSDTGTEIASFESRDPAAAQEWVRSVADRVEAGLPPVA